jgi:hypothetical protein
MLKDKLTEVKGELFNHFATLHIDMNSKTDGTVDFGELGCSAEMNMKDIFAIKTVDDLDKFCEDYGLNDDTGFELSFASFAKKYC